MHRRQLLIIVKVLWTLLFTTAAHAQLPQISSGLSYLSSSQSLDGAWQTQSAQVETSSATVSVLETLKLLNQTSGSAYGTGISWLQGQSPRAVAAIADRSRTLNLADGSAGELVPLLDAVNKGWGGYLKYRTNPLDTSLALQTLKSANYTDTTILNPSLAYLTGSQNSDGGWGFTAGDNSSVYLTAIVSATLQQFPQMAPIASAVGKATAFLLTHQNPDGGFGSSPSTAYETALAYAALAAISTDAAPLGNAVNYLIATQNTNGSWDDDPYATALALKVLHLSENKPSPPPPPPPGGKISGTVVDSITLQQVAGVTVTLAGNNLINATTDSAGNFTLNDVPPGNQSVTLSKTGFASKAVAATSIADVTTNLGNIPMTSAYNTGIISGTILDPAGKPLAGAAVAVTGSWSGSAVTGIDGAFSFSYVTPGDVVITASKSGYQSFTGSGRVYARTTLAISPRLNSAPSQLTTGTITGRVVDDYWGFPIGHLPEEQGVRVTISGGISLEPDEQGYFTFQGLVPNTYQITAGMSGFTSKTFRVIVAPGVVTDLGTIRLAMSADTITLVGKVSDSVSGLPIRGAEIYIPETGQTARSDFAGTYAIADINVTQFTVKATAAGYVAKTMLLYQGGGRAALWTQTVDLPLTPQSTKGDVSGRVIDLASGLPISGATITVANDPASSATTAVDGIFTLRSLTNGVQRLTVTGDGYADRSVLATILPGIVNSAGDIALAAAAQAAIIRGEVRDAATGAPFAGAIVRMSGSEQRQTVTAADGTYLLENVVPGSVTVEIASDRPGYHPARITAILDPSGMLIFSPILTTTAPDTLAMSVQTDKSVYGKGETVRRSITLLNREARDLAATLRLRVTSPDGAVVHETGLDVAVAADATRTIDDPLPLPVDLQGGIYTVSADLFDEVGTWLGSASTTFGIAVSRITVTPNLPQLLAGGTNTLLFNLVNSGDIPISSGVFTVALKDPDGQLLASAEQRFALDKGEGKTLLLELTLPPLKFGTYTLVYSQSDETRGGAPVEMRLTNSVSVSALFDSNSHRVRNTTTLSVTLANSGRFALDSGLSITVNVPDAAFSETRALTSLTAAGSTQLYTVTIPATATAGEHNAIITLALSSGSTVTTGAKLVILDAALALGPLPTAYAAGEAIVASIANNGGVDAAVQYKETLYDATAKPIAETSGVDTAVAGAALAVPVTIPLGAVDGVYTLEITYRNSQSNTEEVTTRQIAISGVKGALQVMTGKQGYLGTESIVALSSMTNSGIAPATGNLHLQVTTAAGSQVTKTWTSNLDFRQGTRSGIDTYETADAVTLLSSSDNFNDGVLDLDRWSLGAPANAPPPSEQDGYLLFTYPWSLGGWSGVSGTNKTPLPADFDAMVDYKITTPWQPSSNNHPAGLQAGVGSWNVRIDVWGSSPSYGSTNSYGAYSNYNGASLNGKFRIKRVGNNYFVYFWNGSGWVNMMNYWGQPTGPAYMTLLNFGPTGNCNVQYDNFTVSTQTYPSSGVLNLKYDSGSADAWDRLNFNADIPAGTAVKFRTRVANTEAGLTGAAWSSYVTVSGTSIANPLGRWIEVEATLTTSNTAVTPILRDITVTKGHNAGDILWQTDVPVTLTQGATVDLNNTVSALGAAGKYYLQGALTSSTGQTIATADYPFYVVQGNTLISLSPDKKLYKPGETVSINGTATNLATIEAANLALTVTAKAGTGAEQALLGDTFSIPAGGSRPFTVASTAGADGLVTLAATVSQSGTILAAVADQIEVASPKIAASLSGPDSAGNDPVALTLTLANSGKTAAVISVATSFSSPAETVTVLAGETKLLQYQHTITANSTLTFTLSGDLAQQLTKTIAYVAPKQPATLNARIVTDRVSYNAGEKVALTTTISCVNAGTTGDTLVARLLVAGSDGEALLTENLSLPLLDSGRVYPDTRYWNSAAYPPGAYTVKVVVEGGRVALATAEATFTILPSSATAAGVTGTVSGGTNPVYLGIDQPLAVTVTNNGNEDLTGVTCTLLVVNPDSGAIVQTYTRSAAIPRLGTFADTVVVPTASLEERTYLAVLQMTLPGMAEAKTLAGFPFSVKVAPPPTLLVSTLSNGAITNNQTLNITGSVTGVVPLKSVTINGAIVSLTADNSFSHALLLLNGDTLVETIATDILAHTATDSRTITLDMQAPTLTIDSPADNNKTALSPIEIKGSVNETSTVTIKVKESVQAAVMNGSVFSATVVPEPGWNTIEITATDLAGNSNTQKRSVLFDDQKPSLTVSEPNQDSRTNKSSLTIGGSASDPVTAVGITVAVDGAILTPSVVDGKFSQVVAFSEEKLYPITVTATNEVGTQTIVQRNVIYDITPPTLTIDPVATPTNAPDQIVTGTRDEGADVTVSSATATLGVIEYPTTTTWRLAVSGLVEGENLLRAETTDLAGNRTTATATILYVPKAPEITVTASPNQLWPPNKKLVAVVLDGSVVTFGSTIKETAISVADEYGTYNLQGLKFGDTVLLEAWREGADSDGRVYTITVVVTDQAGNRTTKTATVVVPHDMGK